MATTISVRTGQRAEEAAIARRQRPRSPARVVAVVAILVALAWSLAPVYWMLVTSFKSTLEAARQDPTYFPSHPTSGNYNALVGHSLPFTHFFLNSLFTSLIAAVIAMVLSAAAGYSLSRGRYRTRAATGYLVLIVRMLPLVTFIGPLYLLLRKANLLDSYVGLVIGYTTFALPFGAWMMKGFIDAIPRDIEEAAIMDGCSRLRILWRIVVPLSLPGLFTTGTFVFMDAWNNLLYPLTLMNTLEKQTLPPGLLTSFTGQFSTNWGGMMAAATITTIPLIIAFFAVQRYMVRGLTGGALAGE